MKKIISIVLGTLMFVAGFGGCSPKSENAITQIQQTFYAGANPTINGVSVAIDESIYDSIFNPILYEDSKGLESFSNQSTENAIVLSNTEPDITITIYGIWPEGSEYETSTILCADDGNEMPK